MKKLTSHLNEKIANNLKTKTLGARAYDLAVTLNQSCSTNTLAP